MRQSESRGGRSVCKGERGALRAGEDNVSAVAAVVCEGRTKDKGAVPGKVPR
jgi:hypothetical protein